MKNRLTLAHAEINPEMFMHDLSYNETLIDKNSDEVQDKLKLDC